MSTSGGAALSTTKGTYTGSAPINDPYGSVAVPSYSGCNQTNYSNNNSTPVTINAIGTTRYVFCNGLSLTAQSSLTLGAGVYVIDRGSFTMGGQSTLTATSGTTIVLTSSTSSGYATANINGGALTVHLHRPSGIATSITVSGGASSLFADGKNMHAIGDISYETPGFSGAADAYRIEVNGGASNVSLDTTAPSG